MTRTNETRHPAFGNIRVTLTSGQDNLFGTTVQDGRAVRIELAQGISYERNGQTMYEGDHVPYVVLEMSELQWARMLSSVGSANGTPCTIVRKNGVSVERIPKSSQKDIVHDTYDKLREKFKEETAQLTETLQTLTNIVEEGKMSKSLQVRMQGQIEAIRRQINDRLPFIGAILEENVHKSIEEAKSSFDAYMNRVHSIMGHEAARQTEGTLEHDIANGKNPLQLSKD